MRLLTRIKNVVAVDIRHKWIIRSCTVQT